MIPEEDIPIDTVWRAEGYDQVYRERTELTDAGMIKAAWAKVQELAPIAGVLPGVNFGLLLVDEPSKTVSAVSFRKNVASSDRTLITKSLNDSTGIMTWTRFDLAFALNKRPSSGPVGLAWGPQANYGPIVMQTTDSRIRFFAERPEVSIGSVLDPIIFLRSVLDQVKGQPSDPDKEIYGEDASERSRITAYLVASGAIKRDSVLIYDQDSELVGAPLERTIEHWRTGRSVPVAEIMRLTQLRKNVTDELSLEHPESSMLAKVANRRFSHLRSAW